MRHYPWGTTVVREETVNTNPFGSFPVRMEGTAVEITDTKTGETHREFNYNREKAHQEAWSHFDGND
jgi:hypothetical protein